MKENHQTKNDKRKVLILSYFFPPCNLTASQRAMSWAKYLGEFGYYPVIVTRNWDRTIAEPSDQHHKTHQTTILHRTPDYEVYYLPYKPSLRDKIFTNSGTLKLRSFRQFLTFWELLLQHFTDRVLPFRNFYSFSRKFLKANPDIKTLIVTANPNVLFKFGYKLSREFDIKWVADYRDYWTIREETHWYDNIKWFRNFLHKLEQKSEMKWTSTASFITSVSDLYTHKLSTYLGKKGYTVFNGFVPEDFHFKSAPEAFKNFTVTFNGTMIERQDSTIFLKAFRRLAEENRSKHHLHINFVGTGFDTHQEARIKKLLSGLEDHFTITKRLPRKKVIEIQIKSQVLLLMAYGHVKGAPGTKTFDYLGAGKPIILCPSDQDILEEIVTRSGLGFVCNTEEEAYQTLKTLFTEFITQGMISVSPIESEIMKYSRRNQTKEMADALNTLYPN
jgi:glycosyltransferase involved in cell wall biosynthesis